MTERFPCLVLDWYMWEAKRSFPKGWWHKLPSVLSLGKPGWMFGRWLLLSFKNGFAWKRDTPVSMVSSPIFPVKWWQLGGVYLISRHMWRIASLLCLSPVTFLSLEEWNHGLAVLWDIHPQISGEIWWSHHFPASKYLKSSNVSILQENFWKWVSLVFNLTFMILMSYDMIAQLSRPAADVSHVARRGAFGHLPKEGPGWNSPPASRDVTTRRKHEKRVVVVSENGDIGWYMARTWQDWWSSGTKFVSAPRPWQPCFHSRFVCYLVPSPFLTKHTLDIPGWSKNKRVELNSPWFGRSLPWRLASPWAIAPPGGLRTGISWVDLKDPGN